MRNIVKRFNSISFKLIITLIALYIMYSSIIWYKFIYRIDKTSFENTVLETMSYLEIIKEALIFNMMNRHSEIIQTRVDNINTFQNLPALTLISHSGEIKFSSDITRLNKKITRGSSQICNECHIKKGNSIVDFKSKPRNWFIEEDNNERYLKAFIPIKNQLQCYTAECHVHKKENGILGVLESEKSLYYIDTLKRERNIDALIIGTICFALIVIIISLYVSKLINRPLTMLSQGFNGLKEGYYGYILNIKTKDEMGALVEDFNTMIETIKRSSGNINEKMQMLEQESNHLKQEIIRKEEDLKRSSQQYIHTEKLASLGRMSASIAHEINSPLTGILTFAHLILNRTPRYNETDRNDLQIIINQAERCSNLITVILGYSRAFSSNTLEMSVNKTILNMLYLIRSQKKYASISVRDSLDQTLPLIQGDSSQIEQVFTNLFINAADAMDNKGTIIIKTRKIQKNNKDYIEIEFEDTGPGIPKDSIDKIFEPFFTTKPDGKGTGLGLAVTKGIIEKLEGTITVVSETGKGAKFVIHLPIEKNMINNN
ncbi:integral membrane sensor signal transduction histidine kinase [Candidatus Magnetoovum chiemensis]|nr:integral membrane sensor signal transduction histidine kinase [Candidatus Magnetoovum chiemensis]